MIATSRKNWNPEKRVTIRQIKGVNKTTYEVYARLPNGTQFRQRFNNQHEAAVKAEEVKIHGANLDKYRQQNERPTSLTSAQEGDYHDAMRVLAQELPKGWSLHHAITYAANQYNLNDHKDVLVLDALKEYIQFKEDQGSGTSYVANVARDLGLLKNKTTKEYEPRPKSFAALNKYLNHVTQDEFRSFILKRGVSKTTQNSIHKTFTSFINWASSCKPAKCAHNLLAGISRPKKDTKDPIGFTAQEAERIIREAEKVFDGELVPLLALSFFGGLRAEEIAGNNKEGGKIPPLLWSKNERGENENYLIWDEDEDEDGNTIDIIEVRLRGKKAWRRTSRCPENLCSFLKKYRKESGEIAPKNWRKKYDYIRAKAGFKVEISSLTTYRKNRKGESVEFDSLKVEGIQELKEICNDAGRPEWIANGARHSCLSCYAKLNTVQEACDWGGNTPKVFHQNYDIGVTTKEAKEWFRILPSE